MKKEMICIHNWGAYFSEYFTELFYQITLLVSFKFLESIASLNFLVLHNNIIRTIILVPIRKFCEYANELLLSLSHLKSYLTQGDDKTIFTYNEIKEQSRLKRSILLDFYEIYLELKVATKRTKTRIITLPKPNKLRIDKKVTLSLKVFYQLSLLK